MFILRRIEQVLPSMEFGNFFPTPEFRILLQFFLDYLDRHPHITRAGMRARMFLATEELARRREISRGHHIARSDFVIQHFAIEHPLGRKIEILP
ncbi:MAG: hypothetical protein QG581_89, partial [Patescibacteria group bacterium]|nr:hypothetical protein [Patescibacteria group bacterium]